MKQYSASVVRERFSEALDQAERGEPVFIERKGVRYRLSVEPPARRRKTAPQSRIEVLDEAALEHGWTWDLTSTGLRFRRRRRA
ncbi:MAG: hypothetical protein ABL986_18675 [Vicinamibacterales bacterium]